MFELNSLNAFVKPVNNPANFKNTKSSCQGIYFVELKERVRKYINFFMIF